jgi:RNA polymerase sigma-70 factor (ECF subfamily)
MRKEPEPPDRPDRPDRDDEKKLVLQAAGGDQLAFEALIRRKRERVFWIAYRIVGNEDEARDIAQLTFIRLWKVLPKFDPEQNFDTWLHRITVNLAIDQYRSRGPSRETVPLFEGEEPRADAAALGPAAGDPLEALQGSELKRIFETLAAKLGERQRAIFVLSQIEGMPTEEIAALMGISHSTVRNHLFQARRSLQEGLREFYPEYFRKPPGSGGGSSESR